jgi:hypothetical protein
MEDLEDSRSPVRWHLKKEIQITHLITTIVVGVSAITYINKMDSRLAVLEAAQMAQRDRDERQDKVSEAATTLVHTQLDRMDAKLDRLVERIK